MPETPEPDEQKLWELQAAHDEAMDDVALNQRVYEAVKAALGRIAREHYPAMGQWNAEQLRKLADRISRHAASFYTELSDLDFQGHKKK